MSLKSNDQLSAPVLLSTYDHKHYVEHNYQDHSQANPYHQCTDTTIISEDRKSFPMKLQELLDNAEAEGYEHIISWQPHGRAFLLHKKQEFVEAILPRYFGRIHLLSFMRQLNLYDCKKITQGPDRGSYYHEMLLRGMPFLASCIYRKKSTGMKIKLKPNPEAEPKFYLMPFVPATNFRKTVIEPTSIVLPEPASDNHLENIYLSMKFHNYTNTVCPFETNEFHAPEAAPRTFSNPTSFPDGGHEDDSTFDGMLERIFMDDFVLADDVLGEFLSSISAGGKRTDDSSFINMELEIMYDFFP